MLIRDLYIIAVLIIIMKEKWKIHKNLTFNWDKKLQNTHNKFKNIEGPDTFKTKNFSLKLFLWSGKYS